VCVCALAPPEFGVSEKRTERDRQSITISTLRFENLRTALTRFLVPRNTRKILQHI
jgi:hypothetical protein